MLRGTAENFQTAPGMAGGDRFQCQPDTVTSSSSSSPSLASGNINLLLYPWEIFVGGLVLTLNVAFDLLWLRRIFFIFLLRTSPDTQAADGWIGGELFWKVHKANMGKGWD